MAQITHGFEVVCMDILYEGNTVFQCQQMVGIIGAQRFHEDHNSGRPHLRCQLRKEILHPLLLDFPGSVFRFDAPPAAVADGPDFGAQGDRTGNARGDVIPPLFVMGLL